MLKWLQGIGTLKRKHYNKLCCLRLFTAFYFYTQQENYPLQNILHVAQYTLEELQYVLKNKNKIAETIFL